MEKIDKEKLIYIQLCFKLKFSQSKRVGEIIIICINCVTFHIFHIIEILLYKKI